MGQGHAHAGGRTGQNRCVSENSGVRDGGGVVHSEGARRAAARAIDGGVDASRELGELVQVVEEVGEARGHGAGARLDDEEEDGVALRECVRVRAVLLLNAAFAGQAVERPAGAAGRVAQVLRDEVLERVAEGKGVAVRLRGRTAQA